MKTSTILKILNPVLFIATFAQFANIIAQKFFFADWLMVMHALVGYSIGVLVLLHIVFNWTWVKNNFFKSKKKQSVLVDKKSADLVSNSK